MTLITDSVDKIKASLLVAIKNELTTSYPTQFGDYSTNKGDICSKVYWSDTVRFQPRYPYCMLTPQKDISEGKDEIRYVHVNNKFYKRVVTRSFMTVSIDVFDMGNEQSNKSSLEADTFAHKIARQLRKYFNGDEMLEWFSGNTYYSKQIGITVDSDISSIIDWQDTTAQFRYSFDIQLGWDEINDTEIEPAEGAKFDIYENDTKIDEFVVEIGTT